MTAHRPFLFLAGALIMTALACSLLPGAGGEGSEPASTEAVFEEGGAGGESEAGGAGSDEPAATEPPVSGDGSGEGATCLTGTWEVDDESYLAWLQAAFAGASISDLSLSGDLFLVFDGEETYTLNGPLAVNGCVPAGCGDAFITYTGSGTYSVVGDNLVLSEGPTVETEVAAFGMPASATVWAVDAPYTCSGDTLTFAVNEFPAFVWDRQ